MVLEQTTQADGIAHAIGKANACNRSKLTSFIFTKSLQEYDQLKNKIISHFTKPVIPLLPTSYPSEMHNISDVSILA